MTKAINKKIKGQIPTVRNNPLTNMFNTPRTVCTAKHSLSAYYLFIKNKAVIKSAGSFYDPCKREGRRYYKIFNR